MEKQKAGNRKVVITGPESTGKTKLAQKLAMHFGVEWVAEFAREYVESLNRQYIYTDVEEIAKMQIKQLESLNNNHPFTIFDTGLIITKVWFDVVYSKHPIWLPNEIERFKPDLCLLCNIDLPWVPDKVRENGGEMRRKLFSIYKSELESFQIPFEIISGQGNQRLINAIKALNNHLEILST